MNEYAVKWNQAVNQHLGLKGAVRRHLRSSVISMCSSFACAPSANFLRCLYCHNVFDDQVLQLDEILGELKRLGDFINTDTFIDIAKEKRPLDGRYFHLSFDDGFRNNFTNALPVLMKHEVPAIFFVPSRVVDADYNYVEKYSIDITHHVGVIETLRKSDLHEILRAGYEIGSHTRSHARFSEISSDPDLLKQELCGSKEDLESMLGVECKYISWPYGKKTDADNISLDVAKNCGYHACFGAFRGSVIPQKTDMFRIPRHHFEVNWPLSHITYFSKGYWE